MKKVIPGIIWEENNYGGRGTILLLFSAILFRFFVNNRQCYFQQENKPKIFIKGEKSKICQNEKSKTEEGRQYKR